MTYCHTIDSNRCKGCGLCVSVCPKKVLKIFNQINSIGYYPAFQAHPKDCVFCAMCCLICPDVAITIIEIKEKEPSDQGRENDKSFDERQ
jgi:2-oxoglutarate ferredoxin oxidoreductase subunit delta